MGKAEKGVAVLCVKTTFPKKFQLSYKKHRTFRTAKTCQTDFLLAADRAISTAAGKHRVERSFPGIPRGRQEDEGNVVEVFLTFLWPKVSRGLQQENNKAIQNKTLPSFF